VRNEGLQVLRALAAVAVVYLHALDYAGIRDGRLRLAAGVDVFFVLSGYIVSLSAARAGSLGSFWRNRARRVLPLYWLATAAAIGHVLWRGETLDGARVLGSFFLWPWPERLYLAVGWTLSFELFFYLLLGLRRWAWLALLALGCWNAMFWLFALGIGIGKVSHRGRPWMLAAGALWIACLPMVPGMEDCTRVVLGERDWVRFFGWGPGAALAVWGMAGDWVRFVKWPRWAVWLGDVSYEVYLFQIFGLMAGAKIWGAGSGEGKALLLTASGVGVGALVGWLARARTP
jgi:exopolysaccharide production protein ExoZ